MGCGVGWWLGEAEDAFVDEAGAVVLGDGGHGALAGESNAGEGVVESGIVRCVEDDVGDDEFHEVLSMYRSEQGLQLWSDGTECLDQGPEGGDAVVWSEKPSCRSMKSMLPSPFLQISISITKLMSLMLVELQQTRRMINFRFGIWDPKP